MQARTHAAPPIFARVCQVSLRFQEYSNVCAPQLRLNRRTILWLTGGPQTPQMESNAKTGKVYLQSHKSGKVSTCIIFTVGVGQLELLRCADLVGSGSENCRHITKPQQVSYCSIRRLCGRDPGCSFIEDFLCAIRCWTGMQKSTSWNTARLPQCTFLTLTRSSIAALICKEIKGLTLILLWIPRVCDTKSMNPCTPARLQRNLMVN